MELGSFIIQKVAHPSSINLQLSSATGELLKKKKKKKNDLFPTTTTFSHKLYKFELYTIGKRGKQKVLTYI